MLIVETDRLQLVALNVDEFRAMLADDRSGRGWVDDYPTDGDLVLAPILIERGDPAATVDAPWGPCQVRLRASGLAIGGVGFKGRPDQEGEVEIGYGFAESMSGRGYATEAAAALIGVGRRAGLTAVIAETHQANRASQRVLERLEFVTTHRIDDWIWWRRPLP